MLSITILVFALYNGSSMARNLGGHCSIHGAPYGKCGNADKLNKGNLTPASGFKDSYVCGNSSVVDPNLPYMIGWSHSCMVPAGAMHANDTSCITTPNLIGEIIDTITTVGIGIDMRDNFCSFGGGDTHMEGALMTPAIFNECNSIAGRKQQDKCRASILRGVKPDGTHMQSYGDLQRSVTGDLCQALPNLDNPAIDENGQYVFYNGKQVFCPVMRCNIPTDTMISKYYDRVGPRTAIMSVFGVGIGGIISAFTGDCSDLVEMSSSSSEGVGMWDIVRLRGSVNGDKICTQMKFTTGYTTLACKPRSIPKTYFAKTKNCYVRNTSCVAGEPHSKGFFPLTATLIECVNDLVTNMFNTPDDSSCPRNPLAAFQDSLKNTVKVLLILYVIVFGIRIAMGGALPKRVEFFIFILKFAFITYFAVGGVTSDNKTGLEIAYNGVITAMHSFSNMVAGNDDMSDAGTNAKGLCRYDLSQYESGYEYLALWDSLDCRISFYLGFSNPMVGNLPGSAHHGITNSGIFGLILPLFFGFSLILLVFSIAFAILLVSTVVYFTHVYVIALIAISINMFLGPIFIPLALFKKTKSYFDSWLQLTIAYTLYPAVITAFLAIMVTTYDSVIYKGCEFERNGYGANQYWKFDTSSATMGECRDSLGYMMAQLTSGSGTESVSVGGLFHISRIKHGSQIFVNLIEPLMVCVFFMFLFYYFAQQLSAFAADISQATNIGAQAIKPTAVADLALDAATKGNYSKAKEAAKAADGKKGGVSVAGKGAKRKGISVSKRK